MASKRRLRRKACEGKVRHETLEQARLAARSTKTRDGKPLNSYKCGYGNHYHNGHYKHQNKYFSRGELVG